MPAHNSKHLRLLPPHFAVGVVLVATACLAQSFERHVSGAPFEYRGEALALPFLGGVNFFLPQFLDIDGDEDLDLFLLKPHTTARDRQLEGRLTFLENRGTPQTPRFIFKSQFLPGNGATEVKPFLYDWNRDDIVDLFLGQRNGRVLYYQGTCASEKQI